MATSPQPTRPKHKAASKQMIVESSDEEFEPPKKKENGSYQATTHHHLKSGSQRKHRTIGRNCITQISRSSSSNSMRSSLPSKSRCSILWECLRRQQSMCLSDYLSQSQPSFQPERIVRLTESVNIARSERDLSKRHERKLHGNSTTKSCARLMQQWKGSAGSRLSGRCMNIWSVTEKCTFSMGLLSIRCVRGLSENYGRGTVRSTESNTSPSIRHLHMLLTAISILRAVFMEMTNVYPMVAALQAVIMYLILTLLATSSRTCVIKGCFYYLMVATVLILEANACISLPCRTWCTKMVCYVEGREVQKVGMELGGSVGKVMLERYTHNNTHFICPD